MGKTAGKRTHLEMTEEEPLETGAAETLPKVDHGFESLMKYGDHIENFLAICEDLPGVLKSDLKAVANINERTHCLTTELSREQGELLARAKMQVREATRPEHLVGLIDKDLHEKVKEKRAILYSEMDEKVDITKRMYDILDSAIKTVDRELGLLETDVEEGYGAVPDYASLVPPPPAAKATAEAGSGVSVSEDGTQEKSAAKTVGKTLPDTGGTGSGADETREDTIGLDEPIYCVCRQIGFGEMIGCDNDDCEHGEWFHYDCVGLPKQDIAFWLCPGCTKDAAEKEEREKQQRRKLASIRREHAINNAVKVAPSVKLPSDDENDDDSDDDGDGDRDGDGDGGEDRNHYDKDIDEGDDSAQDNEQADVGENGSQEVGEEGEAHDGEVEDGRQ